MELETEGEQTAGNRKREELRKAKSSNPRPVPLNLPIKLNGLSVIDSNKEYEPGLFLQISQAKWFKPHFGRYWSSTVPAAIII